MQAVLVMFKSDGERRSFSLHKDITVIGRREDCDMRIPLGEISRKHARVIKDGETIRVEDMGSSNGTYHNGQRVQEAVIQAGDTVQIGSIVFVMQVDGVPADDELNPVIAERSTSAAPAGDSAGEVVMSEDSSTQNVSPESSEAEASAIAEPPEPPAPASADDFDPMAILDSTDSQSSAGPLEIDLEKSRHGQET